MIRTQAKWVSGLVCVTLIFLSYISKLAQMVLGPFWMRLADNQVNLI